MSEVKSFLLNGQWTRSDTIIDVTFPYDAKVVGQVCMADKNHIEKAVAGAVEAFKTTKTMPSYKRAEILATISNLIRERAEELAQTLTLEVGKPIAESRGEITRTAMTFQIAAEEAKRIEGDWIPLDLNEVSVNRHGILRRFPVGPVFGITPFNFPLNLAAHKIAPALAVGNPILLKPATKTPLATLMLGEIMLAAGVPEGGISILPCRASDAETFISDPRIKVVTFTGSPDVGWKLKKIASEKKVALELGGNAACIVHSDANVDFAAERIKMGGFSVAGQSCIHVQRIFVQEKVYNEFLEKFLCLVKQIKIGNPLQEHVTFGPMIDEQNAIRIEKWTKEAVEQGATLLCGGKRNGTIVEPTVLEGVPKKCRISCVENFGPAVTIDKYSKFKDAVAAVDDSVYGLQAGLFTRNIFNIENAYQNIDVGALIINDVPTWRVDHMPYGGVKKSGFGREGIRYAIEDMTEYKLLALNFHVD